MGRQKGEARSKARPSSSSLAASLLPSESAAATVGFGGYIGSSRFDPSLAGSDSGTFPDVDSEVAVHLKRLGRKDATTKLKALASLSLLFKQKPGKEIVPILPQWAFEYKRLLLDYNREVRRAANDTMANLVVTVGRDIAPHLKSLMGPWWFSQFDPVPEVSSAGKQSLQAAFPAQEKRLDALMYCTSEIFMYLEENLKLTPQSMSDRSAALDELEEMHQQAISSSLLALATLLDVLICVRLERPSFEDGTVEPRNASKARATAISLAEKLFYAHKCFLDFLKSKSPTIRSATYSVLSSFIKNIHEAIEGNLKTLAPAILGAFEEKDPICHSSMWDVILLFSRRFPDSWMLLNVQKTLVNQLWHFLRNGCFGSQKVSYPALVLFLDVVPSKAVGGEKFFLDFLHNLWAGRNLLYSSSAEHGPFFQAFRECFLWVLQNASRYCGNVDTTSCFQATLVDDIPVKLLWQDYLFFVDSRKLERVACGMPEDIILEDSNGLVYRKKLDIANIKYPTGYLRHLGTYIVEILSGIYLQDRGLLSPFCMEFQKNCLGMFQETESGEAPTGQMERIIQFISLLEQHAIQKGETWPLAYLIGPMWTKSFALIKSLDLPDAVELLSVTVSLFGPRKIVREFLINDEAADSSCALADDRDKEVEPEKFVQVFKETFIPWCLLEHNSSNSARLDLLLVFLDDEYFSEQWHAIISHAIDLDGSQSGKGCLDSDWLIVLTMLLEKARAKIMKRQVGVHSNNQQGFHPDYLHHKLLDSAVIAIASSIPPIRTYDAQFVCAVLGGSTEGNQISFVSRNTVILIFKEVFKKILTFVEGSSFTCVRESGPLLTAEANNLAAGKQYSTNVIEIADFALEVLNGSFFCLETLKDDHELVSGILASIFVIKWEHEMLRSENDALDDVYKKKTKDRLDFGKSILRCFCRISDRFWSSLSIDCRKRLGIVLVHFVRASIFQKDELGTAKISSLGCNWMLELLDCLCQNEDEEQILLDQLLSKGDKWPVWVNLEGSASLDMESVSIDFYAFRNLELVSLIDKLCQKIGIDKVIGGAVKNDPPLPQMEATDENEFSRAWLAAEMLCTWNWPEGGAVISFLPSLTKYAKNQSHSSREKLLDSIFNILLDVSLINGGSCADILFRVCPALDDVVDKIEEPYLRALVSLLATLFKADVWAIGKGMRLLDMLASRLHIGEVVNQNCLKILPLIVSVLLRFSSQRSLNTGQCSKDDDLDSLDEHQIQDTVKDWLRRTLLLPPLVTWQTGQDIEEWFLLVLSCYPIGANGVRETLKLERNISSVERALILDLYRKQRIGSHAFPTNLPPLVQMLLSKLMIISVGYCWKEFIDEDWEFFFSHLRCWIQSAVVMMEEVAENINDAITGSSTSDNMSVILKNLGQIVLISNDFPIDIASNALASFSLFCGHPGFQQSENVENPEMLLTQRFDPIKDRIVEGILRIFFCTGIAEAIASSYCDEATSTVASSRLEHLSFWKLIASNVVNSSLQARDRAVKSVKFWSLSKGPIDSLYAILFSTRSIPSLQFAAYVVLTTEPISQLAVIEDESASPSVADSTSPDLDTSHLDLVSGKNIHLKEEISCMIEKSPFEVLETDLVAQERVNVFLAWSLFLSHLSSFSLSSVREQLVQYVLDSTNLIILDCIFQHIPLDSCMSQSQKKRDTEIPAATSAAASAATHAITTGSLLFYVESLWPIDAVKMASLAGALLGLMLRVLPAYARGWFTELRDRSFSPLIESFVRSWCSPPLVANELLQIKKANIADENLEVSVSKSTNEVVATYKKEETGMDLIIRLPASYPLRPVDIDCTRSLGISEVKRRKWLMSLASFVHNQNGALAEAIRIWKRNLHKEFEHVEECPICYSVIHTVNHSLPRLACKTCKHKFHSHCLFKWFRTSHKSTCPLCQSQF
ncbi:E3 ubiquitin-protein ligase listerin isoform X2 [Tripterygium wilfordii]|uniref:E3 ubiquitin-protein ligase listerin isoform X2 n=1 Tax=Tripterygium wilfordii TaxID=458696 RepID=UPI0018F80625|nr:E3 ubiquitin-protein ligase listerin isoform X2 [Tripterygium wilfordii]